MDLFVRNRWSILFALVLLNLVLECQSVLTAKSNQQGKKEKRSIVSARDAWTRHEEFYGFTAWAQATMAYVTDEPVVFTGALTNEGSDYNQLTGEYTCPVDGVYMVMVSLRRNENDVLGIRVYQDEEVIITAVDTDVNDPEVSVSHSVLTYCTEGLIIQMRGSSTGAIYGNPSIALSTFTVFLVSQYTEGVGHQHEGEITGFTAVKQATQNYLSDDTIVYDLMRYQGGNDYSTALSRFTCPVSGTYFVSTTSYKNANFPCTLAVTKLTDAFLDTSDTNTNNTFVTSTNNGMFFCYENETVNVRGGGAGSVYGLTDTRSSFTMFLIDRSGSPEYRHEDFVGFTMYKKSVQAYEVNDVITFDGDIYNFGGWWEDALNRFVCPETGIYLVMLNAKKFSNTPLSLYTVLQSEAATQTLFEINNRNSENYGSMISNSAVFRCTENQVLQVKGFEQGVVSGAYNSAHTSLTVIWMTSF